MPDIAQQLERRRAAVADAWDVRDAVVLVAAGDEIPVPGRGDRTYPFRSHSEYLYLTVCTSAMRQSDVAEMRTTSAIQASGGTVMSTIPNARSPKLGCRTPAA
jgi:hypothetical protein